MKELKAKVFNTVITVLKRIPVIFETIALVVLFYWLYKEQSPEPLASVILVLVGIIAHFIPTTNQEEKISHRLKIKKEFEENAIWRPNYRFYGSAVIRDVDRMDNYPESIETRCISPFFRVEIKGLYHRGIEVLLSLKTAKFNNNRWEFCKHDDAEALTVGLIGRIPFDLIETIDWGGDEYYREPHFYVKYDKKRKEPYEEIIVSQKLTSEDGALYFERIGNLEEFK